MVKRMLALVLSGILGASLGVLRAQTPLENFKREVESYYSFASQKEGLENFSCLITSTPYIAFIKEIADSQYYYPLKFLWQKSGKAYFILQPLPKVADDQRRNILIQAQQLKRLFRGVFLDWQKYSLVSPVGIYSDHATFVDYGDTVAVEDYYTDATQNVRTRRLFSKAGLLLKDEWDNGDFRVVNLPVWQTVKNKWVCVGWQSQIYNKGRISSGMEVSLQLVNLDGVWLPYQIDILAQSSENPNEQVLTSLYLKNYFFNEKIQVLKQEEAADSTAASSTSRKDD